MYLHLVYVENQLRFTRPIPTGEYDGIPSGEYDEIPIRLQYIAVLNVLYMLCIKPLSSIKQYLHVIAVTPVKITMWIAPLLPIPPRILNFVGCFSLGLNIQLSMAV